MNYQIIRICCVSLTLIFILNLHMTCGRSLFRDLLTRMSTAMSGIYRTNLGFDLLKQQNNTFVTPADMMRQENYPSETHTIVTEDKFILTVYRIPNVPGSPAVYLQHGLLESSADWLIPGRKKSLAYILWDNGYDVWLGNARGNTYSKQHKFLTTSDPKFWNFSWEELGRYDLPAVINYISYIKKDSLFYIGHSMGATSFSVMALERPDVAKKIKIMIALAPATYVNHMRAYVKLLSPFSKELLHIANSLGIYELLPRSIVFETFSKYLCTMIVFRNTLCSNSLFMIAGFSPEQLDYALLPKIWSKFPAGTSMKLFTHWLQQMTVNKFQRFDYGLEKNIKVYNSTEPPEYDLSKLQVPVAVFWSKNDLLVGEEDTKHFYAEIPLKLGIFEIDDEKFNHFDFLWAIEAPDLVYSKILDLMIEHKNSVDDQFDYL